MQEAALPYDEEERLKTLYDLCILDTPAEARFDTITKLATRLFDVPIALVSLVDRDRQWFKSRQGLNVAETARSVSFCAYTILQDNSFVVEDSLRDPRFATNPLVTNAPFIRFYAGHPLYATNGSRLGTLCIIDTRPRQLSREEIEILAQLASWASSEINNTGIISQLAEKQLFIERVTGTIPGLLYLFDLLQNRNLYVNREVGEMLGYSPQEIAEMGATLFPTIMHPDDLALLAAHNARFDATSDGEFLDHDYRLRHKNGQWHWLYSCDTVFSRTPDGRAQVVLGIALDITARKQTEAELKKSQQLYRTLAQNIPGALVYLLDRELTCILVEGPALEQLGWSKAKIEGQSMAKVLPPALYAELETAYQRSFCGENVKFECRYESYIFDVQIIPVVSEEGQIYAIEAIWQDITDRRALEEQTRHSQELFARIFQIMPLPVAINRLSDGIYLDVNHQFVKQSGYSREELIGQKLTDKIKVEPESMARLLPLLLENGSFSNQEVVYRVKDNSLRTALESAEIFEVRGEKHAISVFLDITEQKEANNYLKFMADVLAQVSDAVVAIDKEHRVTYWNAGAERLYGHSSTFAIGKPLSELYQVQWLDPADEANAYRVLAESGMWQGEVINQRLDGQVLQVEATTSVLKDATGRDTGLLAVIRNVTERKRAEEALKRSQEQVLQMQKLESIGRLAGGVAHDFNNLLTGILGYAELAMLGISETDPLKEDLGEIKRSAERGAALTHQLLAFSRRQVLQPVILNLNEVVEGMSKLLRRLIGEDVELEYKLAARLDLVMADRGQIEQVLMNLAVNARDAMPEGGRLVFETKNVELDEAYSQQHFGVQSGRYVRLRVSDNGIGMDEETLSHIFEPFFTTKEQGKGTGLGLATVFGIVGQSGGHIDVTSQPGQGTTFYIYLPYSKSLKSDKLPTLAEVEELNGQAETILLVEDEEGVRGITRKILERNGYQVLEAPGVVEALAICQGNRQAIELVLSDMVMPQMNGLELATQIQKLRPQTRFLFMSGYTENRISEATNLPQHYSFIQKPFSIEHLLLKIREVLRLRS